jgi:hypothetical protein
MPTDNKSLLWTYVACFCVCTCMHVHIYYDGFVYVCIYEHTQLYRRKCIVMFVFQVLVCICIYSCISLLGCLEYTHTHTHAHPNTSTVKVLLRIWHLLYILCTRIHVYDMGTFPMPSRRHIRTYCTYTDVCVCMYVCVCTTPITPTHTFVHKWRSYLHMCMLVFLVVISCLGHIFLLYAYACLHTLTKTDHVLILFCGDFSPGHIFILLADDCNPQKRVSIRVIFIFSCDKYTMHVSCMYVYVYE